MFPGGDSAARKREKQIKVWLNEEEYKSLCSRVEKSNLTQGDFIRKSILEKNMIIVDLQPVLLELKRIGNNLNQLTKAVHQGKVNCSNELGEVKEELKKLWLSLKLELQRLK